MNREDAEKIMINEITHTMYWFFKSKIKFLTISQPDLEQNYKMQFDNFVVRMNRKKGQIYNALCSDLSKDIVIVGNPNDFKFIWTLYSDKRSSFEVYFIQKHRKEFDSSFLSSKIKKTFGYVYILKSEYGYKIGCSSKLTDRLNHFSVILPFKYSVHSIIKSNNYTETEKFMHSLFSNKRLNGEWFNLYESDFDEIDLVLSNLNLKREAYDGRK